MWSQLNYAHGSSIACRARRFKGPCPLLMSLRGRGPVADSTLTRTKQNFNNSVQTKQLLTPRPCIQSDNMAWLQMATKCSRGCSRSVRGHVTTVDGPEGRNTHLANRMDLHSARGAPPCETAGLRRQPAVAYLKGELPEHR